MARRILILSARILRRFHRLLRRDPAAPTSIGAAIPSLEITDG